MLRRAALGCCATALLAGPTTIAFFTGGFFQAARLWAALAAWALVVIAALLSPTPLPRGWPGRLSLAGMAGLTGWVALSMLWAPDHGAAFQDTQRLLLYLGALIASAAFLRGRGAWRAVEPVLIAGAVVVMVYGLSERLLPGLVELSRNTSAGGRLAQPISYWNATGAVAAVALVLSVHVAGDGARSDRLRALATAAAVPLGLALYLSFSRGALAAGVLGMLVLLALSPSWGQLRAAALAIEAGLVTALVASRLDGVQSLSGGLGSRQAQGAAMLAVLGATMLGSAALQKWACGIERQGGVRMGTLPLPRGAAVLAVVFLMAAGAAVATASVGERASAPTGASSSRFSSVGSNRYAYWKIAVRTFAHHPLRGTGSGGFRVEWLRHRPFRESVKDAHSLYLETGAELGIVGLLLLGTMLGGVALAARRALRMNPGAAGLCAGLAVWAFHAGLDWDWEMPAVSLLAIVIAGALIAQSEQPTAQTRRT